MRAASTRWLTQRDAMYWSMRVLLCQNREDWDRYDELYRRFWQDTETDAEVEAAQAHPVNAATIGEPDFGPAPSGNDATGSRFGGLAGATSQAAGAGAGDFESIFKADFRFLRDEQARRAVAEQAERIARRLRKQLDRSSRRSYRGSQIDLRMTAKRSAALAGWPFDLRYLRRTRKEPRLVYILDVSHSMERYSQMLLRFAWACALELADVRVFAFHVRLLNLQRALNERRADRLVEHLEGMSSIWLGGTRISQSLAEFNAEHSREAVNARTIVLIVSDGCDTDPTHDLAAQVSDIRRRARAVVWLNPLLGRQAPDVTEAPMEAGLQSALRYIDLYAPAHNLESLRMLEGFLSRA